MASSASSSLSSGADTPAAPAYTRITAAELPAWLAARPQALRLDARDALRHAEAHLEGALRLDGRNHERLLLTEPKRRPVLIYCYHGHASQTYAQMFVDFGFTEVVDLIGGWAAWAIASAEAQASPALRSALPAALPADLAAWLTEEGFDPGDPDAPGPHGNTPLMAAAWRGRADRVEQLLAAGVRLNAVNGDGNTALWLACVNGDASIIRQLVAAGVPLDHANSTGATALMYAASAGKAAVLQTLLELGADASIRSQDDFTALDMCASLDCLRLLRPTRPAPRVPQEA
jgi:rhodanese-related sulfurtransferase